MRLFLIAGEASGDVHAANLIRSLRSAVPGAIFEGFGGTRMEAEGMKLLRPLDKLSFMGFVEVVKNLVTVRENFSICKRALKKDPPDALILIDYPGFNLRMAKWAKGRGIRVFYYISPQVWAWKENRTEQMRRNIDRLMVILPFEKQFFRSHGMEVDFVGHPLLDEIGSSHGRAVVARQDVVALLPGSREQEVKRILPEMIKVREYFPDYRFIIAKAPNLSAEFLQTTFELRDVEVFDGSAGELLARSKAALVASGTATLEAALLKVPQVVCYKASGVSVRIARKLIQVPYISLVNLILDKPVVKELIQKELNPNSLERELRTLLFDEASRNKMLEDYGSLWQMLDNGGASENAAKLILADLQA